MKKTELVKGGFGTASLVLGILGFLSPVLAILAIIFGAVGRHKGQQYSQAGLVLGITWLAMWVLLLFFFFSALLAAF
ncbi:MAG: hypothetical protein AABY15_04810 [Nanoarchaeota archaeon]